MIKTEHYNLNLLENSDPVRVEPFNENAQMLEQALDNFAFTMGNCRVATGTYVGTGVYGQSNPNRLEFDFTPVLVIISSDVIATDENSIVPFVRGLSGSFIRSDSSNSGCAPIYITAWEDYALSFYSSTEYRQLNLANVTYSYIVFGYLP